MGNRKSKKVQEFPDTNISEQTGFLTPRFRNMMVKCEIKQKDQKTTVSNVLINHIY